MSFNFHKINHRLKNVHKMPLESFSTISDRDLDSYEEEFDEYLEKTREDEQYLRTVTQEAFGKVKEIFGEYSKQAKYFSRAFDKGETLLDEHKNLYKPPSWMREKVEEAKKKDNLKIIPQGCVDNLTMESMDGCISFLLSEGYVFGKDFHAHNAIDISRGVAKEVVLSAAGEGDKNLFSNKVRVERDESCPLPQTEFENSDILSDFADVETGFYSRPDRLMICSNPDDHNYYRVRFGLVDSQPCVFVGANYYE